MKSDFENIRNCYLQMFNEALRTGRHLLHFDVDDWRHTLSNIQLKVYDDIKSIGTYLYPVYPVGEYFIDFGNPFKKVGIEILYKEREREERLECIKHFEQHGWTVYTLESKFVEPSAEELYRRINGDEQSLFNDENMYEFIYANKSNNSECLIYYIKDKYFEPVGNSHADEYEEALM